MLKKTITFEDLDGNKVRKDFYFHLSKTELLVDQMRHMTLNENGEADVTAFEAQIQAIVNSRSGRVIMDTFEDIIRRSYGERDEDNITFNKSEELSRRFMQTNAYEVLFMELCTSETAAAEFIRGIIPKNLDQLDTPAPKVDVHVAFPEPARTPLGLTKSLDEMTREELVEAVRNAPAAAGQVARGGE